MLGQSATHPPEPQLEILSPHLPWRIEVRARATDIFVTVFDVLVAIRVTLKQEITREEWEQFGHGKKDSILAARSVRAQNYESARQVDEMYRHPRRIDALGEFTRFAGLVPAPGRSPTSFDLKFERWR